MNRATLVTLALLAGACHRPPFDESSDTSEGDAGCASDMIFEGQCFEAHTVDVGLAVASSDVDRDGRAELFTFGPGRRLARLEFQGAAFAALYELEASLNEAPAGEEIVFADLTGDGQREAIVVQEEAAAIYEMQGDAVMEIAYYADLAAYWPVSVGPIDNRELLLAADSTVGLSAVAAYELQAEALTKTVTVGAAGCWATQHTARGDFDANGIVDGAFGFGMGDCQSYPNDGGGILVVLVQPDGSFQSATWQGNEIGGITAGNLDGIAGDELLARTVEGVHLFEGGPEFDAMMPNDDFLEQLELGLIGNLGGDDRNEMLGWQDEPGIVVDPLGSAMFLPFFGPAGVPKLIADFNGDGIDDVIIEQSEGSTAWISK